GTKIGGDLNCVDGTFRNRTVDGSGVALGCDGTRISGKVILASSFRSEGAISFVSAKIAGQLDCVAGPFANRTEHGTGLALNFSGAEVGGAVWLSNGFLAEGEVRLYGARVKGYLRCFGGRFDNAAARKTDGSQTWTPFVADALNLTGAKIDGILWMGPHAGD